MWEVDRTDRDGKPTSAWWRCPRLIWPGLAVYREAGRYLVFSVDATGCATPTGFEARNLPDLRRILDTICCR